MMDKDKTLANKKNTSNFPILLMVQKSQTTTWDVQKKRRKWWDKLPYQLMHDFFHEQQDGTSSLAQVISSPWHVQRSLCAAVVIHASNVDMAYMEGDNGGFGPS